MTEVSVAISAAHMKREEKKRLTQRLLEVKSFECYDVASEEEKNKNSVLMIANE